MKNLKSIVSKVTNRFRFAQGLAVGLTASSVVAYAVVNITSFTSGNTISSAAVNTNFANIKTAVERLEVKAFSIVGVFGADTLVTSTCTMSPIFPTNFMNVSLNDESGGPANFIIPETGYYEIRSDYTQVSSGYVDRRFVEVNGSGTGIDMGMGLVRKFNAGDELDFWVSCKSTAPTIDHTKAYVILKKL